METKTKVLFDRICFSINEPRGYSTSIYHTPEVIRTLETSIYRKCFGEMPENGQKSGYNRFAKYTVTSDLSFNIYYYKQHPFLPDKIIHFYSSMHNSFDYEMLSAILNSLTVNHGYEVSLSAIEIAFDFTMDDSINFEYLRKRLWTSARKIFNCWKENGYDDCSEFPPDSDDISFTNYHGSRRTKQVRLYQKKESGKNVNRVELLLKRGLLSNYQVNSVGCLRKDLSWIFKYFGFYELDQARFEKKYGPIKAWLYKDLDTVDLKEFFNLYKMRFHDNVPNKSRYLKPLNAMNDAMRKALIEFQKEFNGGPVLPFDGRVVKKRGPKPKPKKPTYPRKRLRRRKPLL